MRVKEVLARTKKVLDIQPTAVTKQQRIAGVMSQLAINDQQPQPATEDERVLAMFKYDELKKQKELDYEAKLRQVLAAMQAEKQPKKREFAGRTRR